ncbi:MAG: TetR/AcrR family transcriptional regulator [Pseudomonadales bacterium]
MNLRQQRKAALRERIAEVCGRLFRERGFDDTTITDITREVGISRQTFFNHFSGKEAVLTQLGLDWLRAQAAVPRLDARASRAPGRSILAGTRQAVLAQMRAIEADADFMRLVFTRSGVLFPQAAAAGGPRAADQARVLFDNLALVIRAGQDGGEIRRDLEPLQVAELYVATMLMTARLWLVDYWGSDESLETRAARALDVLEAGLAPTGRDRP